MSHLADITWPIFFLQGDVDPLCALTGAQAVMDKASSTDKTLKVMKGAYHLVHWEPKGEGTQAVKDIVDWVKERCTP
ncbi:hypothetical protein NP493_15g02031 [Ridgeia piscesae]|uniref:Serine aminopeptidase S33 domain-containing protein n=1 Tax=Ridgeia piscesae TaxID=27915 RepID=A0AAD9PEJ1_RIDPI|nr:hypothetical protein NP493_15g02031 [Ridgeia piscesae]